MDFFNVIFSNKFRANLKGLHVWACDWVLYEYPQQVLIIQYSGRWSVMILTGSIGSTILWPFK